MTDKFNPKAYVHWWTYAESSLSMTHYNEEDVLQAHYAATLDPRCLTSYVCWGERKGDPILKHWQRDALIKRGEP